VSSKEAILAVISPKVGCEKDTECIESISSSAK